MSWLLLIASMEYFPKPMSTRSFGAADKNPAGSYVPSDPAGREAIKSFLAPGENLIWAGRPNRLGMSIYAIAFGVFLMLDLLMGTHQQFVYFSAIMVPLGAIGTFIQTGIFYGITDQRVLWFSSRALVKKVVLDLPLCDAIGVPLKISCLPMGILSFTGWTAEALGKRSGSFSFFLGSRASAVQQMVIAARRKQVDDAEQAVIAGRRT